MLKIGDKKLIHGWAFYDWANSVYSLVISTAVFSIVLCGEFTNGKVISFFGFEWEQPDTLYSYTLSFFFFGRCFDVANIISHRRLYRK